MWHIQYGIGLNRDALSRGDKLYSIYRSITCDALGIVGFMMKPQDLGHYQVGSYRCRSLIEGLYTL